MQADQGYSIDKARLTFRVLDNEAVILDLNTGYYYSLNETGTLVWQALYEGKAFRDILSLLKQQFPLSESQLAADLNSLLEDLEHEKLIGKK